MKKKKIISLLMTSLLASSCAQSVKDDQDTSAINSLSSVEVTDYLETPNLVDEGLKMPKDRPVDVAPLVGNYLAAMLADYEGDTPGAAEYYKEAENADPENYYLKQRTFVLQLSLGNMDEAVRLAKDLATFNDALPMVYIVLFTDAVKANDLSLARSYLQKSIQSAPELLNLYTLKGYLELADGVPFEKVLADFKTIQFPDILQAHKEYHLGRLLEIGGRQQEALEMYKKAAEFDPSSIFPVLRIGAIYRLMADYEAADAAYTRFEKDNENSTMLYNVRQRLSNKAAVEDLDTSLSYSVAETLFGVSTLMGQTGDKFGAKQVLSMVAHVKSNFALVDYYRGILEEQTENPSRAVVFYSKVEKGGVAYLSAQLRLAYLLIEAGEEDQGLADMEALFVQYPHLLGLQKNLAEAYYMVDRYQKAIDAYTALLNQKGEKSLTADDAWYMLARGSCYEKIGNYAQAEADIEKAIELRPNYAQALNYLGYMWVERKENLEKAFIYISKAVLLMPSDPAILDSMGWVLHEMGQADKALFFLEKSISLEANDPTINSHLGDVYLKLNRIREAVHFWKVALSLEGLTPDMALDLKEKIKKYENLDALHLKGE